MGDGVGRYVDYRGGSIYWTSRTGARAIYGAARSAWLRTGGPRGPLGYPTAERVTRARAAGGASGSSGASSVTAPGPATSAVTARSGPEVGALGRESGAGSATPGTTAGAAGTSAAGGRRSSAARSGRCRASRRFAVTGQGAARWLDDGAETGRWGYPTGDVRVLADGTQRGTFEKGTITA